MPTGGDLNRRNSGGTKRNKASERSSPGVDAMEDRHPSTAILSASLRGNLTYSWIAVTELNHLKTSILFTCLFVCSRTNALPGTAANPSAHDAA